MSSKNRRLEKLVEAVATVLGDRQKAKKLRKAKALARFVAKLEDKHREMERELAKGSLDGKAGKEKAHQAQRLDKQITRAKKLLAEMK